jgi:hypothetical protein
LSFFSNDSLLEDGGVAGSREWAEYFVGLYMLFCLYQMTNDLGSLILPSFFRLSQPIYLFQLRFREWEVSILARLWELWEPFKLVDPNGHSRICSFRDCSKESPSHLFLTYVVSSSM